MQLSTITNLNDMQQGEVERNRDQILKASSQVRDRLCKNHMGVKNSVTAETAEEALPSRNDL